jgi:hypothetical protein
MTDLGPEPVGVVTGAFFDAGMIERRNRLAVPNRFRVAAVGTHPDEDGSAHLCYVLVRGAQLRHPHEPL